jgi:PhzF family phenazine biosynthesis protein
MQRIAREINASETAFLTGGAAGLFKVRFFTPAQEVDFCGHATVAMASALAWDERIEPSDGPATIKLAVKAGDLDVELRPHEVCGVEVVMTQAKPRFADFGYRIELLAGALGLDSYQIPPSWPLGLAYTGLWALIVPVATQAGIDSARPDFAALTDLNRKLGCASTHLYTHAGPNRLYCRDFSPAVGVAEDPVTGSALGAMAALLVREGAVALSPPTAQLTAEQGHAAGRPGEARIQVDHDQSGPTAVRVAGTAVPVMEGHIRLA